MNVTSPPSPSTAKVLVRLPRGLHDQLKRVAGDQGVSTNTLMATLLAGAVGFALDTVTTEEETMQRHSLKATVNGRTFARQAKINERTFRRWLRDEGEGVGLGAEYELPAPDTPEGRRILDRFHARRANR